MAWFTTVLQQGSVTAGLLGSWSGRHKYYCRAPWSGRLQYYNRAAWPGKLNYYGRLHGLREYYIKGV